MNVDPKLGNASFNTSPRFLLEQEKNPSIKEEYN